jgi:benzoate membrane transport protein
MSEKIIDKFWLREISPNAIIIPFISCVVGFGGTIVLIIQSQAAIGASSEQIASAITSLCAAISILGFSLTLFHRVPVILGWSTPGAALLAGYAGIHQYAYAVTAFMLAGAMTMVVGYSATLTRVVSRIPVSISNGMLAGIVFPFCLPLFKLAQVHPILAVATLATFIAVRSFNPMYALVASITVSIVAGGTIVSPSAGYLGDPFGKLRFVSPAVHSWSVIELAVPLFLVTLVSQNLPGLLVIRSAGYSVRERLTVSLLGFGSMVIAPFGGHGISVAALTAAMCVGDETGLSSKRRWIAGVMYAAFYGVLAIFCGPVIYFFSSMSRDVLAAIIGVAVLPILAGALNGMVEVPEDRDAAALTFAVTASGMVLIGIGSAFWGLVVGGFALTIRRATARRRRATPPLSR